MISTDLQVITHDTEYSHRKEIRWSSIGSVASGKYVCRANVIKDDSIDSREWDLEIVEPKRPDVIESNIDGKSMKHLLGEPLQLRCEFSGIPRPNIKWYKDGNEIINEGNNSRMSLNDDNTLLDIHYIKAEDEGRYKCVGSNRIGTVSRQTELKITSNEPIFKIYT